MHFYEAPEIPMLFDLAADEGEVRNMATEDPGLHRELFDQMMHYFEQVDARIPKENPDYDQDVYTTARGNEIREKWGPFKGERPLEEDEQ
jgi:hypothetical protein